MLNFEYVCFDKLNNKEKNQILSRPLVKNDLSAVKDIIVDVINYGDKAIIDYSKKFDGVNITDNYSLKSDLYTKDQAIKLLNNNIELYEALKEAYNNIYDFHAKQKTQLASYQCFLSDNQINCQRYYVPINTVGLYIPGGNAALFSSLLMMVIPAKLAGVKKIVVCSPPDTDGNVTAIVKTVASFLQVDELYAIGGAQAIAAMAAGTMTVPKVDKIFGPGNQWVTHAKKIIGDHCPGVSIDMPAGPSEVLVIADKTANVSYVASDLLAQAEHGSDSQMICVYVNDDENKNSYKEFFKNLIKSINYQLSYLKTADMIKLSLKNARFIYTDSCEKAIELSNTYAPEHLILSVSNSRSNYLNKITNAGSIFIGHYTPESLGDYASGTNHVLPTYGFAASISGLGVESFVKSITVQEYDHTLKNTKHRLAKAVMTLAEHEGLDAHKNSMKLRLDDMS